MMYKFYQKIQNYQDLKSIYNMRNNPDGLIL